MEREHGAAGLTLVELLVALVVASVALTASWAWLWNAAAAGRATAGREQAATAAAAAVRAVAAELQVAVALVAPDATLPSSRSVCVRHRHVVGTGEVVEEVLIAWDPARQVLWRKTPSAYLADHVSAFRVEYFDAIGAVIAPNELVDSGRQSEVARVRAAVEVRRAGFTAVAVCEVAMLKAWR